MKVASWIFNGILLVCLAFSSTVAMSAPTKGMFTIITAAEPEVQMMALVLTQEAEKKGHYVRIMLCGSAGSLALHNSEETLLKPINRSPQTLLRGFIKRGVTVNVCPLFLPNRGLKPDQLLDGVGIGKPPEGIGAMLEENIQLFSF